MDATERVIVNDIMSVRETAHHLVTGSAAARAPMCRSRMAAIIAAHSASSPMAAGNSRSVPAGVVVDQIRTLAERGYREVVLTGVDITAYGGDLPGEMTLGRLVAQDPEARAGTAAPAPFLYRHDRGRRAADPRARRGRAADAASASVAAGRATT